MASGPKEKYDPSRPLVFQVEEITERGGLSCRVNLPQDALKEASDQLTKVSGVRVNLEFSPGSSGVLVEGEFSGVSTTACSRCLKVFSKKISGSFEETYPVQEGEIDLKDKVSETVILSLDFKPLCSPGCKGLCPKCGTNLNEKKCSCKPDPFLPFGEIKSLKK